MLLTGSGETGNSKEEKQEEEKQVEEEPLPMRAALHPAEPGQATGKSPSTKTGTRAAGSSPSGGPVTRAARRSPCLQPGAVIIANTENLQCGVTHSRKRQRLSFTPQNEADTAAAAPATAAHIEAATAADDSETPDSKLHEPSSKRIKRESPASQLPSLHSRGPDQHRSSGLTELIIISDSDEEKPKTDTSSGLPSTPHSTGHPISSHARTLTATPMRTPNQSFKTAVGTPDAPNTGSASDPIVIVITESDDDDQMPSQLEGLRPQPGSA